MNHRLRTRLGAIRLQVRKLLHQATAPLLGPVQRRQNERWRRHVLDNATDVTEEEPARLLVIAPHPDDETIGCAATIARRVACGSRVDVVVVSDGGNSHRSERITEAELGALRQEESRAAMAVLGVDPSQVRFLSFSSEDIRTAPDRLITALAGAIRTAEPDEVLTTSMDEWSDEHRLIGGYVREALRSSGSSAALRFFPVWHWDFGPATAKPSASPVLHLRNILRASLLIRSTPQALKVEVGELRRLKEDAFACYVTQTTSFTGERSWAPFPAGWLGKFLEAEVFFPNV